MAALKGPPPGRSPCDAPAAPRRRTNLFWAQLMARSVGFDVLACPRCGDRLELIAVIETRAVIEHAAVFLSGVI
jgi:hypothetical protein